MATFHPFPRLPTELRLRIWELTASNPRVVEVRERGRLKSRAFWASPTPVPAVLHTCRESRSLLLSPTNGGRTRFTKAFTYGMQPRHTWVNFAADTIHTDDFTVRNLVAERPLIRWLTVDSADSEHFYHIHMAGLIMSDMPALERLVILTHENVYDWQPMMEDLRRHFDERQAAMPGYPFTDVCIVDQSTGETVDAANYKDVFQEYEDMHLRDAEYENPADL
ncbi:hypothetical protein B0T19DRAFT_402987 [Cercophora scortea]|uniref:2EXR domain-containing protein n=1 Tax=Cercophora scortea TaxID=314031 RepID=A0AAE0IGM6_9PEZI|nr:hypothetical protein B0T19DRAFT_402987 [Cercophora scortea]